MYTKGRKRVSRSFVVFILPNNSSTRFGLTTPRKLGRAHERNRIRRLVREILRQNRHEFREKGDVVVNPRRSVLGRGFGALEAELVSLLRAL